MGDTTPPPPARHAAPRIAVTGLTIRGYRSLRRVEWPKDGLGWGDRVPEIVLVGGVNGSGKTTLLEVIFGVVSFFRDVRDKEDIRAAALRTLPLGAEFVHINLDMPTGSYTLSVSSRDVPGEGAWSIRLPSPTADRLHISPTEDALEAVRDEEWLRPGTARLLYYPTDRAITFPATKYKGPGAREAIHTIYRYRPPESWDRSMEAIFYDARWRDLNAKDQGHPEVATHFVSLTRAMAAFFGDTKRFVWDRNGVLQVVTEGGEHHSLAELSSGEKQVLLFVVDLFQNWTPGSLVLIDEPELHLHEAWLAILWREICRLQRERGGQVILTTQSNYLFGLGEPGSRVLLGGPI